MKNNFLKFDKRGQEQLAIKQRQSLSEIEGATVSSSGLEGLAEALKCGRISYSFKKLGKFEDFPTLTISIPSITKNQNYSINRGPLAGIGIRKHSLVFAKDKAGWVTLSKGKLITSIDGSYLTESLRTARPVFLPVISSFPLPSFLGEGDEGLNRAYKNLFQEDFEEPVEWIENLLASLNGALWLYTEGSKDSVEGRTLNLSATMEGEESPHPADNLFNNISLSFSEYTASHLMKAVRSPLVESFIKGETQGHLSIEISDNLEQALDLKREISAAVKRIRLLCPYFDPIKEDPTFFEGATKTFSCFTETPSDLKSFTLELLNANPLIIHESSQSFERTSLKTGEFLQGKEGLLSFIEDYYSEEPFFEEIHKLLESCVEEREILDLII